MNAMLKGHEMRVGRGWWTTPFMSDRHAPLPPQIVDLARLALGIRDLMEEEDEEGQVALVCAILNRRRRFGPEGGGAPQGRSDFDFTEPMLARAFAVACLVLSGDLDDPTDGATHFHRHDENPRWARRATPKALIGGHLFYVLGD